MMHSSMDWGDRCERCGRDRLRCLQRRLLLLLPKTSASVFLGANLRWLFLRSRQIMSTASCPSLALPFTTIRQDPSLSWSPRRVRTCCVSRGSRRGLITALVHRAREAHEPLWILTVPTAAHHRCIRPHKRLPWGSARPNQCQPA